MLLLEITLDKIPVEDFAILRVTNICRTKNVIFTVHNFKSTVKLRNILRLTQAFENT